MVLELSRKPYAAPAKQPPSPFQDALGACVHMDGEEWAAQCVGGSAHEFASEVTVRFLHYDHTIIPGFDQFLVRGAHPSFASFRKSRRASPEPELAPPPLPAPPEEGSDSDVDFLDLHDSGGQDMLASWENERWE